MRVFDELLGLSLLYMLLTMWYVSCVVISTQVALGDL